MVRMLEHRIGGQAGCSADHQVAERRQSWRGPTGRTRAREHRRGGIVSPCLANVYLHYVLDLWFHKRWRKRMAGGDATIVPLCGRFCVRLPVRGRREAFSSGTSARGWPNLDWNCIRTRPGSSHSGATRKLDRRRQGQGKPETFDFLGMTHYCDQTRKGRFRVGRRPSRKRVNRTLRRIKERLRGAVARQPA